MIHLQYFTRRLTRTCMYQCVYTHACTAACTCMCTTACTVACMSACTFIGTCTVHAAVSKFFYRFKSRFNAFKGFKFFLFGTRLVLILGSLYTYTNQPIWALILIIGWSDTDPILGFLWFADHIIGRLISVIGKLVVSSSIVRGHL